MLNGPQKEGKCASSSFWAAPLSASFGASFLDWGGGGAIRGGCSNEQRAEHQCQSPINVSLELGEMLPYCHWHLPQMNEPVSLSVKRHIPNLNFSGEWYSTTRSIKVTCKYVPSKWWFNRKPPPESMFENPSKCSVQGIHKCLPSSTACSFIQACLADCYWCPNS